MNKFLPLLKVDESAHLAWGVACSEAPDSDGEIADYAASKAEFMRWSEDFRERTAKAGQATSLGNVRLMHSMTIAGKITRISFDDTAKRISVGTEPANDEIWEMLRKGLLTGYSIGGSYQWKRPRASTRGTHLDWPSVRLSIRQPTPMPHSSTFARLARVSLLNFPKEKDL